MKLKSEIRFANEKLRESFLCLQKGNSFQKEIYNSLNCAFDDLEIDAFSGIQVSKRLIPEEYVKKYNVKNLWKYNLPRGWRLIYSIKTEEFSNTALILDWFDHKVYERKFNY